MSDWLYPLSSQSNFYFELPGGRYTKDTSPANFERSVLRTQSDDQWTVAQNFRRMTKGDRVWIYYGHSDGDLGVVGLGVVDHVDPPNGRRADVHLRWDKARTRRLLVAPLPAAQVRKYVWPRGAVADLSPHPALVRALCRQAGLSAGQSAAPSPAKSKASTLTYTPPAQITVRRRHDAMILPVQVRLETCGWARTPFNVKPKRVDLAMKKGRNLLLAEFKTITGSTAQPVRDAFAQLREYAWRYRRSNGSTPSLHLWAVFERQPVGDEIAFLEAEGIFVSWASRQNRRINHAPHSRSRLQRLGVAT